MRAIGLLLALSLAGCVAALNDAPAVCERQKANISAINLRCGHHWGSGMPDNCGAVIYVRCDVDACGDALASLTCDVSAPSECFCHYATSEDE